MVTEDKPIHSIPHQRNSLIKGIVNISGEVQLCFSLGSLLGVKEGAEETTDGLRGLYNCLIVLIQEGKRYVFPVSEFRGLHRYNKKDLQSTPATIKKDTANFLIGVIGLDELNVGCLDSNIVFNSLEKEIR
jgi:chemotaxis-related protein WspD